MDSHKPVASEINWYNYLRYVQYMHFLWKEYLRAFLWLYEGPEKPPWDFLTEKYSMTEIKKYFGALEREKLKEKTTVIKMDISLLFRLLQHTCGLATPNSDIWKDASAKGNSLESIIHKLKEIRNAFTHSPYKFWYLSTNDLETHKRQISYLLQNLLQKAGAKCHRTSDHIDVTIEHMESELDIATRFSFSDEKIEKTAFLALAVEELSQEYENITIPSWFVPPVFFSHEGSCAMMLKNFPCMLDNSIKSITVLIGELGMGKTTICRHLVMEWLRKETSVLNLQQYRLVFLVHRKGAMPSTYEDFMRRALPETLRKYNFDWALSVLREFKVLWLFDGLDEARGLVDDLISRKLQNHSVIITSRAEVALDFLDYNEGNHLHKIMIWGIPPELQRLFVREFLSQTNETEEKIGNILTHLQSLPPDLQEELMNPLKLTLLVKTPFDITEFSLGTFYQNIMENNIDNLKQKVESTTHMTKRDVVRKVINWYRLLCLVAFDMLKENVFISLPPGYEKILSEKCDDLGLNSSTCLSTFLLCERNVKGKTLFRFIHGSQQQYLIACHVRQLLEENKSISIISILFPNQEDAPWKDEGNSSVEGFAGELVTPRMRRKSGEAQQKRRNSRNDYSYHLLPYFGVLTMLTSCLSLNNMLSKKWIKELCSLLKDTGIDMGNTNIWFDIIKEGKYSENLVSEVALYIRYKRWYVTDIHVTAAYYLMCKVFPDALDVYVIGSSYSLAYLEKLLKEASKHKTVISLHFRFQLQDQLVRECSDKYIQALKSERSVTSLSQFHGHLTSEGIKHLAGFLKITSLSLRIDSGDELLALHSYVEMRKGLSLLAAMDYIMIIINAEKWNFCSPLEKLGCYNTVIVLALENLRDENLESVADLIFQIAKDYRKIIFTDSTLTGDGMLQFIDRLRERSVEAESVLFCSTEPGVCHMEFEHVFPPSKRDTKPFIQAWMYGRLRVTEISVKIDSEQNMNVSLSLENTPR